ncbi:hypothetical protein [Mycobacterium sp. IS-1556]|uniref:hypothetical protein n=1 Tax=Mycobacterium sp. IS-1556 TaxID=1772276 RepID=UPI0009E816C6|nr:hypothetical protein [Mycobacterium sp. IS-1556]
MTTYATSTTHQTTPTGGPPAPPPQNAGGPPTQRTPHPRRAGMFAAAGAFVIAAAAAVATAVALANPITPAQHTVNIVPPPPAKYTSAQILAAKESTCAAWEQAARTLAVAAKSRAALADSTGGSSPETRGARTNEKLVGTSQIAHLREKTSAATPPDLRALIDEWTAAQIDSFHSANIRDWGASNTARDRGNDLVDVIAPACGLR